MDTIRAEFKPTEDAAVLSQIHLALFMLQEIMRPFFKHEQIKPHYIFAFESMIRTAIQNAVAIISPGRRHFMLVSFLFMVEL